MIKLFSSISPIYSYYYENFFGIDGPISLWINDYVIKYGKNKKHFLIDFLNKYVKNINQTSMRNKKIQEITNIYENKIKSTYNSYVYIKIQCPNYIVGQYIIGEKICINQNIPVQIIGNMYL